MGLRDVYDELRRQLDLPVRPFLYTIDQIATLLQLQESTIKSAYLHYDGRSVGKSGPSYLTAVNIAPDGETPEWRVSERELIRWLRRKKIQVRTSTWGTT